MPRHCYQHFLAQSQPWRRLDCNLTSMLFLSWVDRSCFWPPRVQETIAGRILHWRSDLKKGYYCLISAKEYVQSCLEMHIYTPVDSAANRCSLACAGSHGSRRRVNVNILVKASWNPACQIFIALRVRSVAVLLVSPCRLLQCRPPPSASKATASPRCRHTSLPGTRPLQSGEKGQ